MDSICDGDSREQKGDREREIHKGKGRLQTDGEDENVVYWNPKTRTIELRVQGESRQHWQQVIWTVGMDWRKQCVNQHQQSADWIGSDQQRTEDTENNNTIRQKIRNLALQPYLNH